MTLNAQFAAYSDWRSRLAASLTEYQRCLGANNLSDAQTEIRLAQLADKLREDRLHVAFVAEFSRGKSELINAIFFADYGSRMLPSAAGRTTMCPTELLYDKDIPPAIELLPIRTREANLSVSECKRHAEHWTKIPLNVGSAEALQEALRSVSEVERVAPMLAEKLGFAPDNGESDASRRADDGLIEIPRWRHAIINFPHPLLERGLVILDTPGLNAIGAEPELTLSLLPNAHAVLFLLAADTGVTQSDLAIWNEYIGTPGERKSGRLVALNKIDGLWDELKSEEEIAGEIAKQADYCARTLDLPATQVFPISAQKGLIAKVNRDENLLIKSRLPALERALSEALLPAKQEIVQDNTKAEFLDIYDRTRELLDSRLSGLREQLGELTELRGKNRGVVHYMMTKVKHEKEEFEAGLQRYYAVRSVFSQLTNNLFGHLGLDALRLLTASTRETMSAATFSVSLSDAMHHYFEVARANLDNSEREIAEILSMMDSIYKKFSVEHGLKLGTPARFSLGRYRREIERLEYWCNTHLNTLFKLLTNEKKKVMQRFFEEVANQVRRAFERANRDAELWLKAIMVPMEIQVREHQIQLKHRLESIKRIHQATDTLEERINELVHIQGTLVSQIQSVTETGFRVRKLLDEAPSKGGLRHAA